jgi:adenylate cyclase
VPPVARHGGEILKFLGDGFFAIFPYEGADALGGSVLATARAVTEAESALAGSPLGPLMSFRSAIHAGRFHYGNVGGASRLDFTAIGQPVSYAARLLQAGSALACPRVLSAQAAPSLGEAARPLAEMPFKGFEGMQAVYTY